MSDKYQPINCEILKISQKAILVLFEGEEHWVPQSLIFEDDLAEVEQGFVGEINVAEWFYIRELSQ